MIVGDKHLERALACALRASEVARQILLRECARPEGPRGDIGKCPADDEAELAIRDVLIREFPAWGFLGEESEFRPPHPGETDVWVVDPNDGTTSMQRGYRGHAVSIALLREGIPVLGVVQAVDAPDDRGDLFAWAEGCGPLERNGIPIPAALWPSMLQPDHVVGVSQAGNRNPLGYAESVAPARFIGMPSIAYRLALVAAGEHVATLSLNYLQPWDYAAGHALLRAAGGVMLDEHGRDIRYRFDGEVHATRVFAGPPPIVRDLIGRNWEGISRSGFGDAAPPPELYPMRAQPGRLIHNPGVLSRAQGCLLGLIAGDWREGQSGPYAEGALLLARTLASGEPAAQSHQPPEGMVAYARAAVMGIWGTFRGDAEVAAAASGHADALFANMIAAAIRDGSDPTALARLPLQGAPIASALMGAVRGRDAFPQALRNLILSSRPMGPSGRSPIYWPTDALVIAERLLTSTATPGSVSYALTA